MDKAEHIHDYTVPVCTCGERWEYMSRWSVGGVTYSNAFHVALYRALYGEPIVPFERVDGVSHG